MIANRIDEILVRAALGIGKRCARLGVPYVGVLMCGPVLVSVSILWISALTYFTTDDAMSKTTVVIGMAVSFWIWWNAASAVSKGSKLTPKEINDFAAKARGRTTNGIRTRLFFDALLLFACAAPAFAPSFDGQIPLAAVIASCVVGEYTRCIGPEAWMPHMGGDGDIPA